MDERERIKFIANRDGKEACRKWAEQTLDIYRTAAIDESKYKDSIKSLEGILAGGDGITERDDFRAEAEQSRNCNCAIARIAKLEESAQIDHERFMKLLGQYGELVDGVKGFAVEMFDKLDGEIVDPAYVKKWTVSILNITRRHERWPQLPLDAPESTTPS